MTAQRLRAARLAGAFTIMAGSLASLTPMSARAAEARVNVSGTIVSVRGSIYEIRPSLRPKKTRVSVDDKTTILTSQVTTIAFLKPGMHVVVMGTYTEKAGFHPFRVTVTDHPVVMMGRPMGGFRINKGRGFAFGMVTIKTVDPFVVTDTATGTDYTGIMDHLREVTRVVAGDRSELLIGVRASVEGTVAGDGVIKATSITPEGNFTTAGTMFGKVVGVAGNTLTLQPRYTTETLDVTLTDPCNIQRQIPVDPDSIKVGDTVTFWSARQQRGFRSQGANELTAIALLPGKQTYPTVAPGDAGGQFITGKIASLDPVKLELPDGKQIHVLIPGQMLTANLTAASIEDLKPGAQVCVVMSRKADGGFQTQLIIIDASPFVGYGG